MFYQLLFHFLYLGAVVGVLPRGVLRELVFHEVGVELALRFLVFVEARVTYKPLASQLGLGRLVLTTPQHK